MRKWEVTPSSGFPSIHLFQGHSSWSLSSPLLGKGGEHPGQFVTAHLETIYPYQSTYKTWIGTVGWSQEETHVCMKGPSWDSNHYIPVQRVAAHMLQNMHFGCWRWHLEYLHVSGKIILWLTVHAVLTFCFNFHDHRSCRRAFVKDRAVIISVVKSDHFTLKWTGAPEW